MHRKQNRLTDAIFKNEITAMSGGLKLKKKSGKKEERNGAMFEMPHQMSVSNLLFFPISLGRFRYQNVTFVLIK